MLYLKLIAPQGLNPPGNLTLRLHEAEQPGQGSMIRPQERSKGVERDGCHPSY